MLRRTPVRRFTCHKLVASGTVESRFTAFAGTAMIHGGEPEKHPSKETAMARGLNGRWMAITALAGGLAMALIFGSPAFAQTENASPTPDNAVMITILLKHDQSRPLTELNAQLERQGFYKAFPPDGVEVVSWYVMMGIGQVVTLRL